MLHPRTATLQVMYVKSKIMWDCYKRIYGEDNLRSEITMKRFVKRAFCSVKAETSFFLDALDFRLDLGIRQNIICQLLQWAISPKFSPSKILYRSVLVLRLQILVFLNQPISHYSSIV